jgi:hypothetical protein
MKWSDKMIAAVITSIVGLAIITFFMAVVYRHDSMKVIGGAVVMVCEFLALILIATIFLCFRSTKRIGQGTLIGTGVTMVIGFGICSLM